MADILVSEAFWFGAFVLLVYQWAKFSELSADSVETTKAIPNLRASDFAGPAQYSGALVVFLAATFVTYLLVCSVSPAVVRGWLVISGADVPQDSAAESVPYPIYIAALYMGLTQPTIPVLSKVADLQKGVFHYWIGIPQRVVNVSDYFVNQLLAKAEEKEEIAGIIERMVSNAWFAHIDPYADVVFYKNELKKLNLPDEGAVAEAAAGSKKELRNIVDRLVYIAALATVRQSGGGALGHLGRDLGLKMPDQADDAFRRTMLFLIISVFSLVVLMFVLPLVSELAGSFGVTLSMYWPTTPFYTSIYLLAQMLPVLIALGIVLLFGFRKGEPEGRTWVGKLVSAFEKNASVLLVVFVVVVAFDYIQLLADYSSEQGVGENPYVFLLGWAPYHMLHAVVSVSACLVLLLYGGRMTGDRPVAPAFLTMSLVVAVTSGFYAIARLAFQFADLAIGNLDFVALVVLLNVSAGALGLSAVLGARLEPPDEQGRISARRRRPAAAGLEVISGSRLQSGA